MQFSVKWSATPGAIAARRFDRAVGLSCNDEGDELTEVFFQLALNELLAGVGERSIQDGVRTKRC